MENKISVEQALDFLYRATQGASGTKAFHDQALQAAMLIQKFIQDVKAKEEVKSKD